MHLAFVLENVLISYLSGKYVIFEVIYYIMEEHGMNIQIFGTKKCNETKKAQRYFKERGIKFQFIDMSEKEISKGELRSVSQVVGGLNALINEECKDKDALALVKYISADEREEKLLANQQVIKTPIVRNGKQATVGFRPEVWKTWS